MLALTTPAKNLSTVLLTPVNSFLAVLLTPRKNFRFLAISDRYQRHRGKTFTCVNNTTDKLFTGVNGTANFSPAINCIEYRKQLLLANSTKQSNYCLQIVQTGQTGFAEQFYASHRMGPAPICVKISARTA